MKNKIVIISVVFIVSLLLVGCPGTNQNLLLDLFEPASESLDSFNGTEGIPDVSVVNGTEIYVTQGSESSQINIIWAKSKGASSYVLYRAKAVAEVASNDRIVGFEVAEMATWTKLAVFNGASFCYSDKDIDPFSGYSYSVKCLKIVDEQTYESPLSYVRTGWCFPDSAGVSASTKISTNFIEVKWKTVPGANKYIIYRGEAPLKDSEGNNLSPTEPVEIEGVLYQKVGETISTLFEDLAAGDLGPVKNILYFYRIAAVGKTKTSSYLNSAVASGEVLAPGAVPPPALVTASRALTDAVEVSWNAVGGSLEYVVYRSGSTLTQGELDETLIVVGRSASPLFLDQTAVEAGVHYWYGVACVNKNGDEGRMSIDTLMEGGAVEGSLYNNEGYSINVPVPVAFFATNDDQSGEKVVIVNWPAVEGADLYRISVEGGAFEDCLLRQWVNYAVPADFAGTFEVKAVNLRDTVENESAISGPTAVRPALFTASNGAYEGSGKDLRGKVDISWDSILPDSFSSVTLVKKGTFQSDYTPIPAFNPLATGIIDRDFPEILYSTFAEGLKKSRIESGETADQALLRRLSNHYQIRLTTDSASYSISCSGWRMFSARESFFLFKVGDHVGSNHTTNQITEIFGAPNKFGGSTVGNYYPIQVETDQGYYGGSIVFDPYQLPGLYALLEFRFQNISDFPGFVMNGSNYVWKNSGSGMINNPDYDQNPDLALTLFSQLNIAVVERYTIDKATSAILSGSKADMVVKLNGTQLLNINFSNDEILAFFAASGELEHSSSLCPGGRNYTRGTDVSSGHYGTAGTHAWVDPVDCGPEACLASPDSVEALATEGR